MADSSESSQNQLTGALYISYTAVVVMMSSLGWVIAQILTWILPETRFNLLLPFEVLVAIEAIISTHALIKSEAFSIPWLSRRTVEWIVLIVLAKLLTYASLGLPQLAADLLVWDEDFATFFTLEFVTIVIVTAIIWVLTCHFAAQLIKLQGTTESLDLELKGIGLVNRQGIRQGLTTLIFLIGGLMLAVVTTIFLSPQVLPKPIPPTTVPYWSAMLYFIGGLLLLAVANIFSLHSRWYLHGIHSNPRIWLRWLLFSLVLIGAAAIIAILLPTRYSFGLLGVLQIALEYLIYGITVLQFLIFTPIIWLLNYMITLFGGSQVKVQPPSTPQVLPPSPSGTSSNLPFLDLMRSIFFWTIFFSIIFIAFRVYIRQNKEVINQLRKQPYLKWFFLIWDWFKSLFSGIKRLTSEVVAAGRASMVKARRELIIRLPEAMLVYEKLPPRQKIRFTYLIMTEWLASVGYPRQKQDSPGEYAKVLTVFFPMSIAEIEKLTELFVEARYRDKNITTDQSNNAESYWKTLQTSVKTAIENKSSVDNK